MKKKYILLILAVLILTGVIFYFATKQTIFQPSGGNFYQIQYDNAFVILNGNKIETRCSKGTYIPIWACKTSPIEGGSETYIDEDGCQHWDVAPCIDWWSCVFGTYDWANCGTIASKPTCKNSYDSSYTWNTVCCGTGTIYDFGGKYSYTTSDNMGCYLNCSVYFNSQKIDEVGSPYQTQIPGETSHSPIKIYFPDGTFGDLFDVNDLPYPDGKVRIDFNQQNEFTGTTCVWTQTAWFVDYPQKLDIIVSSPQETYIEGQDVEIDININSDYLHNINANLKSEFKVPTILGEKTKTEEQWIEILPGNNVFSYSIPTETRTEKISVKPYLEIYFPTTNLNGLSLPISYFPQSASTEPFLNWNEEPYFYIGEYVAETSEFQILSKLVQCYTDADCEGLNQCPGINMYCDIPTNTCYYDGVCITQPPEKSIWQKIVNIWSDFLRWISGVF